MRTLAALLLAIVALVSMAGATTTTINVIDTDAQSWNNGTYIARLVEQPQFIASVAPGFTVNGVPVANQFFTGSLNGSGTVIITLTDNSTIAPAGSGWQLLVCPQASIGCFTQTVTVSGGSQTVNLTPPGIRINGANAPPTTLAYGDFEIVTPSQGTEYFNVTTKQPRFFNGTVWSNLTAVGTATGTALSLIDVTDGSQGFTPAIDDGLQNNRCDFTANSPNLHCNTGGTRAAFRNPYDIGHTVIVSTTQLPLRLPISLSTATAGGCPNVGILGDATRNVFVYVSGAYFNGTFFSLPSYENFAMIPAGTTNACVFVSAPGAPAGGYVAGYNNYKVYVVSEIVDTLAADGITVIPGNGPAGVASGTEYSVNSLQTCANGATSNPAVTNTCEIDSVTAGAGNPPPVGGTYVTKTITNVIDASNATLSSNIATYATSCPAGPCQLASWGTDNAPGSSTGLQGALDHLRAITPTASGPTGRNGTIYLPPMNPARANSTGTYFFTHTLTWAGDPATGSFLNLYSESAPGSLTLDQDNGVNPGGPTQLLFGGTGPAIQIGTDTCCGGNQINAGPWIHGFAIKSAAPGLDDGAIKLFNISGYKITDMTFLDQINNSLETISDCNQVVQTGYAIRVDAGRTAGGIGCASASPFDNFGLVFNSTFSNVQNGIENVNGKQSENRWSDNRFTSPQFGGGRAILIDSGYTVAVGNTNSGGNNTCGPNTAAYYPIAYSYKDQNTGKLDQCRGESSSSFSSTIIGANGSGTLIALFDTPTTNFSKGLDILNTTCGGMYVGIWTQTGDQGPSLFGNTATGNCLPQILNSTGASGFVQGSSGTQACLLLSSSTTAGIYELCAPASFTTYKQTWPSTDGVGSLHSNALGTLSWKNNLLANLKNSDATCTPTCTGTGADQIMWTYALPANTLGSGQCVTFKAAWQLTTGTASAKTYKWNFGATALAYPAITYSTLNDSASYLKVCNNVGSTTAQTAVADAFGVTTAQLVIGTHASPAENTALSITVTFTQNITLTTNVTTPVAFQVWIDGN